MDCNVSWPSAWLFTANGDLVHVTPLHAPKPCHVSDVSGLAIADLNSLYRPVEALDAKSDELLAKSGTLSHISVLLILHSLI